MTSRGKKNLAMIATNQKSKSDIDNKEFNKTDEQTKNNNDNKEKKTYNETNCDSINVIEPTENGQNELEDSKEDNEENNLVSLCFDSLLEDNATVSLEEESYMYELDENGVLINQTLLNPLEISINSELEQSTNNLERSEVMNDLLDNNETGSESVRSSSLEKNDGVVEQNYQSTFDNEKDNDSDYQPESEINNNSSDSEDSEMIDRTENANLEAEIGNQEENNKARKRRLVANSEEWKRNKNKKLRLEGKPFLGFSKKKGEKMKQDSQRVERRLKETCKSTKCKKSTKRFCLQFTEETRQQISSKFCNETDWGQRKVFVSSNVIKQNTARGREASRRQGTYLYYLNSGDKRLQVCRQMFINTLDLGYKTIQDWSDGCGFQNRNKVLANALLNLAMKHEVNIYQKYLEGHTQMECDSVHSLIERKLKNREIHLPSDYCSVSRECRVTPRPYDVKLLEFNFFKNYAETKHLRYTSLRPGKRAYEPVINDIRCIRYTALPTPEITVKLSYEEPYISLPVRPKSIPVIDSYPPRLSAPSKIKKSKWEHLQELKSVLPKDTHAFYDNILYTK
ncbi:unnamed protein product [Ceutorhynchus assimilis]|uniref:Uncharacterized protein n=1 Tax=Ceutorhynchus assimilis TaxID=467358 RepID=A0A9N9MK27_9CUCU|nr:unnamed protein product [Ceutorhynchus assimilis]